jgi:hypothetical protein
MADLIFKLPSSCAQDLTGQKFGRLTVIGFAGRRGKNRYWNCRCECGESPVVFGGNLKGCVTQSCGCLRREVAAKAATKHGLHGSKIHTSWNGMKNRCLNSKCEKFYCYGGRGITVDPKWLTFEGFYADMGASWKAGLELERIDNEGDYEPSNCRWATRREQLNNTRRTIWIEHKGERKTQSDWARQYGLSRKLVDSRRRQGRMVEMLFDPVKEPIQRRVP